MRFSLGTDECPHTYYNTEHAVARTYIQLFTEINDLLGEGTAVLRIGEETVCSLNTKHCSAEECVTFYEYVTSLIAADKASLEREASANGVFNKLIQDTGPQTIQQKTGAAVFIATMGAKRTGILTKARLMHPLREFSDEDSQLESARFLGSVLTALLKALPQQALDQIAKDQAESVFFAE